MNLLDLLKTKDVDFVYQYNVLTGSYKNTPCYKSQEIKNTISENINNLSEIEIKYFNQTEFEDEYYLLSFYFSCYYYVCKFVTKNDKKRYF